MESRKQQRERSDIRFPIHFIDLEAQQSRLQPGLSEAIDRVLKHGAYIMGPEIDELEKGLSAFCGAKHAISCANGTDALALVLMALQVGAGDAIFVPSFTFAATAEVVAWVGASVVFVDVQPDSFNICPADLKKAVEYALEQGLRPKGIITVDLFGLPADYDSIEAVASSYDLWIMDDAAQSFGGRYKGRDIGTIGLATATSFFPAKPLGCYGDGGAVFTDDPDLADVIKSLRVHGKGEEKYDNIRIGMNGRLDTLQAAILLQKLSIFEDELRARQIVAERYHAGLKGHVQTALLPGPGDRSAWAQFTVVLDHKQNRDRVMKNLKDRGVPTAVYYPRPLHKQTAYSCYKREDGALRVSENLAQNVLSLPMHPYLEAETQDFIIDAFIKSLVQ